MTTSAPKPPRFKIRCCPDGGLRILLPGNVLVCKHCDQALKIPHGNRATEPPEGLDYWTPPA